jgi:mRNA-degrading endonuclease YafQ of YafQ-DinJ toxin-antitoxin module
MPGEKKQSKNVATMLRNKQDFEKRLQDEELKPKGESKKIRQCKKLKKTEGIVP